MLFVCQSYVLLYHSYIIRMTLLCTCMSFICHSYVFINHLCALVCHSYVTHIYSYVNRMSLVCTRISLVCHSYVLVCHPYVTRMYSYVICMSLVCTRMSSICHSYGFYHEPTNVTITYIMPFFERLNWNSILECSDDLHVWYQMKRYMCCKHEKQSIHEMQTYKNHMFLQTRCTFSVRTALLKVL